MFTQLPECQSRQLLLFDLSTQTISLIPMMADKPSTPPCQRHGGCKRQVHQSAAGVQRLTKARGTEGQLSDQQRRCMPRSD